jgi:ribose transport system substrate-binding protein
MKKNKWIYGLLVLMLAVSACAAPAAEEAAPAAEEAAPAADEAEEVMEKEPIKIGYTLPTLAFPFYVRMHDTFIEEAEARGWEYVYVDGNLDTLTQVNAALDLLAKGVDALVMATWWPDAIADVVDIADKSGIPVFFMDTLSMPEGYVYASAAGVDNYEAGYVGGEWMAERLKAQDRTSINLVWVSMASDTAIDRCQGFQDGMSENGIEVTKVNEYLGDTRENGMSSMEDALVTYPEGEVDMVFGYSAQSSLGAYDAIVAANRTEIEVVGFDGEDDEKVEIDKCGSYVATVFQQPDEMARVTADLVEKVLNGETIEQIHNVPAGVYSADCP